MRADQRVGFFFIRSVTIINDQLYQRINYAANHDPGYHALSAWLPGVCACAGGGVCMRACMRMCVRV